MGKMKRVNCSICGKKIHRHDANRIQERVANGSRGEGVFRYSHLGCKQEVS